MKTLLIYSKKYLIILLAIIMLLASVPITVNADEQSIPDGWENDIYLNSYFEQLSTAQTYTMFSRRIPELVEDTINNTGLTLPNFNYEVISGDSVTVSKVENDPDQKATVTAVKEGVSIIKVTYDEVKPAWSLKTYGESYAANTAYMAVEVNDNPADVNITSEVLDGISMFDTFYFEKGDSTPLNFSVTADTSESVKVTLNGKILSQDNGSYTANLENRMNIIGVTATKEGKTISKYYMIDARKIKINVENLSRPGASIQAGDEVKVSFDGITLPIEKLAGLYNPMFGSGTGFWGGKGASNVQYQFDGNTYIGRCGQWDLATNNDFTVTFDTAGSKTFTNGVIEMNWWGHDAGAHTNKFDNTYSFAGMSAENSDYFSFMPDFTIDVGERQEIDPTNIILSTDTFEIEEKTYGELKVSFEPIETTNRNLVWESSDEEILTVSNGMIHALKPGVATVTVKSSSDYLGISDSCEVTVFPELPATEDERKYLKSTLETAKEIEKVENDSVEEAWTVFMQAIAKAEDVYTSETSLIAQVSAEQQTLSSAIGAYQHAVKYAYTVTQEINGDKVDITVDFPYLDVDSMNDYDTFTFMYNSDLVGLEIIKGIEKTEDKTKATTLSFTVDNTPTIFSLINGQVEAVRTLPYFPQWGMFGGEETDYLGQGNYPDIIIKVGEVVEVTSVNISEESIKINDNDSHALRVSVNPNDATNKAVVYTSSDNSIATVDENGVVTGVGDGTVIITAKAKYADVSDSCEVVVENIDARIDGIIGMINNIGAVTLDSSEGFEAIDKLYETVPDDRKSEVVNYDILITAKKDFTLLKTVFDKIEALTQVNIQTLNAISDARVWYDSLSDELKTAVINLAKLETLEARVSADKAEITLAQAVVNEIMGIGKVSLSNQMAISQARYDYNNLSEIAKAYVYNYDVLIEAENIYAKLYNESRADFVSGKISAIGVVTLDKEDSIKQARMAYDALTDEQKVLVKNLSLLVQAEERLAQLKTPVPEDTTAPEDAPTTPTPEKTPSGQSVGAGTVKFDTGNEDDDTQIDEEKLPTADLPNEVAKTLNDEFDAIFDAGVTAENVSELAKIINDIEQLSDAQKEGVDALSKLEEAKEQIASIIQYNESAGVRAVGLQWNIKLVITSIELTDEQKSEITSQIGDATEDMLALDISFVDITTGEEYTVDDTVTLMMDEKDVFDFTGYETIVAVHFSEKDKANFIKCEFADGELKFASDEFSEFAIIGSDLTWDEITGLNSDTSAESTNDSSIILIFVFTGATLLVAVIIVAKIVVYNKKKSS